ncbi:MAG: META domain-containing protein [Hyphomonadaceae bacterium]
MRFAVVSLLLLGACAQMPAEGPPPAQAGASIHLSGTKWRRVDDTNAHPHGATMDFDGNRASGYTGCNRWTADVMQNGEELQFGMIAVTEMHCGTGVQMATEQAFLPVLEAARYAHYDRDALVLLDAHQNVIAEFNSELTGEGE